MRTTIYVDGFNLYYGCLKNTDFKWSNLQVLFLNILAGHHSIDRICYFTARLRQSAHDPKAHLRQKSYLNALQTLANLEIHYENFYVFVAYAKCQSTAKYFRGLKTEEKVSYVNFLVQLLNNACID